jgi:Ca2+-binding EF-hand superfamily protein
MFNDCDLDGSGSIAVQEFVIIMERMFSMEGKCF